MSLAHNGHSQLADSNTGEADNEWSWGGLSPLGRQVIQEMNKWGMMVDVSHPSKGSMMQAIGLSKAPMIASHSAVRTLANRQPQPGRRDADGDQDQRRRRADRRVRRLREADPPSAVRRSRRCVRSSHAERTRRRRARRSGRSPPVARCPVENPSAARRPRRRGGRGAAGPERCRGSPRRVRAPAGGDRSQVAGGRRATSRISSIDIDYAVKLIGVDHVGISSDFDGGGGIDGWNSAAETFNVTLELVRRGYTKNRSARSGAATSSASGPTWRRSRSRPSMCTSSRWFTRMP